jgi:hypothetical protein
MANDQQPQSAQDAALSFLTMAQEASNASYEPWEPRVVVDGEWVPMRGAALADQMDLNSADKELSKVKAANALVFATAAAALAQLAANDLQAQANLLTMQTMRAQGIGGQPGKLVAAPAGIVPPFSRQGKPRG